MGAVKGSLEFFLKIYPFWYPDPSLCQFQKQQLHKKWKYLLFHKWYWLQFSFHYISQNSGELFPKGPASNSIILKKVTLFQGIRQSEPRDPRSSKVYKVIRIQLQQSKEGGGASEAHSQTKEDFSCRSTSRHLTDNWYSCCQTFVALIQPLLFRNSQNMVWLLEPSSKFVLFWFVSIQLLKKHILNPEITLFYQFNAAKALFKVPIICNISFWIERDLPPKHFSENSSDLAQPPFPK